MSPRATFVLCRVEQVARELQVGQAWFKVLMLFQSRQPGNLVPELYRLESTFLQFLLYVLLVFYSPPAHSSNSLYVLLVFYSPPAHSSNSNQATKSFFHAPEAIIHCHPAIRFISLLLIASFNNQHSSVTDSIVQKPTSFS